MQFEPNRVWSKDATTVPLLQTVLMVTVVVTGAIVCLMGSVDVGVVTAVVTLAVTGAIVSVVVSVDVGLATVVVSFVFSFLVLSYVVVVTVAGMLAVVVVVTVDAVTVESGVT